MGGSIYRKNVSGVNGDSPMVFAWDRTTPTTTPTTISRQDSGNILLNFGAMWNPKQTKISTSKYMFFRYIV